MSYTKQTWQDHVTSRPHTYTETVNSDGTKTLEAAGEVLQQGSPMSAERFSHMEQGIADAHSAVSDLEAATNAALLGKVDKETGKGLSSNDYTTAEKNKLAGLSNYDDTEVNNAMVRADAPYADGKSQLYKVVNGTRENIDPVSSGGSDAPYIYMAADEYEQITPVTDQLYWVTGGSGKHGVYLNGSCVEGTNLLVHIYGVSWNGTETTAWTRTDDAADFSAPVPYLSGASNYGSPFDNLMPWSGMQISDRTAGKMVSIPKFWYKIEQTSGNGMKIQIADSETDGFHVSPAHMDRGDGKGERDVVYIGRYHCASDYRSKTGVKPVANITRSSARTSIHNLGSNIWQSDFATRFTLWMLYIVEFADWNSQVKIGYGCGNDSATVNMGYTDSMPYHTGTTLSSRTTYGCSTQYRNIEGLWDNVYDWCDGAYNNSNGLNLILNPANFSDSANGISVGTPTSGYPSKFAVKVVSGTYEMFIPSESNGSQTTVSCDYWGFDSSSPCLYVGGSYYQSLNRGLFYVYGYSVSYADALIGCRPLELP